MDQIDISDIISQLRAIRQRRKISLPGRISSAEWEADLARYLTMIRAVEDGQSEDLRPELRSSLDLLLQHLRAAASIAARAGGNAERREARRAATVAGANRD